MKILIKVKVTARKKYEKEMQKGLQVFLTKYIRQHLANNKEKLADLFLYGHRVFYGTSVADQVLQPDFDKSYGGTD